GWPAIPLLLLLTLTILLRPDLGLALITFSLSFFLATKPILSALLWPLESLLLITTLGFLIKELPYLPNLKSKIQCKASRRGNPKSLDWAALTLLVLGLASTL